MIERIEIAGCASYGETAEEMAGLSAINFIYGPNGAGKTTVSRLIDDASPYSKCAVHWRNSTKMEALVYNRDFVQSNFNISTELKGIFTLGQKNIETQAKIDQTKTDADAMTRKIEQLTLTLEGADGLSGKRSELVTVETSFRDECWKVFTLHDKKLQGALTGYRGNKQKFKDKLLSECDKAAPAPPSQFELETSASSIFDRAPVTQTLLAGLDEDDFLACEAEPCLKKKILGKTDVDIAAMIHSLNNSDWVRQGITFYEGNEGKCPFCQQITPNSLTASLNEYFDEAFAKDTAVIAALRNEYKIEGERIQQRLQAAIDSYSIFLDIQTLKNEKTIFDSRFQLNQQRIENKLKEPSLSVSLEPLGPILANAKQLLTVANGKIQSHNAVVTNVTSERLKLTRQVWTFFAQVEILTPLAQYRFDKEALEKAIGSIEGQIRGLEKDRASKEIEIKGLEKSTTSVQPTVDEINNILRSFGFQNFFIKATNKNFYSICRPDGSDAKDTLSEGERSFITFLYFYHLLRGSKTESGMTANRVVVFDDPVSSLDSDVLFIVGTLIRQVIEEVRSKVGHIKQVFVLTHNVYFHKEISFNSIRSAGAALKDETFWTIRKVGGDSKVKKHKNNPIRTSYELLWLEVRERSLASLTIQNTLRRILENYFQILGGISPDDILSHFAGEDKLICKSLLSWVNDGSHTIPDDIFISQDESATQRYLDIFKMIFVDLQQLNHYNMMMGHPPVIETSALL